ncbi:MAG: DUF4124 domain-containing protein [Xanthomonadales bacterium]|nr:DUF4124 domain-containing protein [Gammaproteobacteria bacterium]MBT8052879.1 DUF4124 domain-containing protein [Gammaproteobacteria bacterium]NND55660.1 DUF4124 domain-containing protein [Xanthomonadales bacterium]NNK49971.1 DUF4124 domain-containing protein [Xanthomonadales bacterium]
MKNGLINSLALLTLILLPLALFAQGEIYKVVDENGNVTFTDQRPASGAQPMDLPPLSVIETDMQTPDETAQSMQSAAAEAKPPTPRELRRQFRDFRITRPLQEETFWGTANAVVVTWGSSEPIPPSMSVLLYVDGTPQEAPAAGGVTLTLDRGEHRVYAELRDERKRRIVTTDPVTFFVKQNSAQFRRPGANPGI